MTGELFGFHTLYTPVWHGLHPPLHCSNVLEILVMHKLFQPREQSRRDGLNCALQTAGAARDFQIL